MLPIYPLHGTEKLVNVESLAALQAHIYALGMRCCPGQTINRCKLLRYCGPSPYLDHRKVPHLLPLPPTVENSHNYYVTLESSREVCNSGSQTLLRTVVDPSNHHLIKHAHHT